MLKKVKLDDYEDKILASYEADEFVSVMTLERKEEIKQIAKNTFKKDKKINICISDRDLIAIKKTCIGRKCTLSNISFKYYS
jgi:predicted DNA binding CopG/RHH family protein